MITDINQLDLSKRYTYADYLTWRFDETIELIRGKIYRMSPAPTGSHQEISGNIHGLIWTHLLDKRCKVFSAPYDVRLPLPPDMQTKAKIDTVVQPDICVICDLNKLDERGCLGAPDWIIEILSKASSKKDLNEKFDLYQHAGVKEYWIVHPYEGTILVYHMDEAQQYKLVRQRPFVRGENPSSLVFPDFQLDTNRVFPEVNPWLQDRDVCGIFIC